MLLSVFYNRNRTVKAMEKYSELSYRDIQARAKELGIAANKKREVLIEAILEAEGSTSVEPETVESIPAVIEAEEVVAEPEPVVQAPIEVVQEPVVAPEPVSVEVEQVENVLDLSLEYFDSLPENPEDDEEEFHECDAGDLIDAFEGMQLRGIPNPSGVKTVFELAEEPSEAAPKIDWG